MSRRGRDPEDSVVWFLGLRESVCVGVESAGVVRLTSGALQSSLRLGIEGWRTKFCVGQDALTFECCGERIRPARVGTPRWQNGDPD
jgi:hypothetical protein